MTSSTALSSLDMNSFIKTGNWKCYVDLKSVRYYFIFISSRSAIVDNILKPY
jgi:hypothetical protein